MGDLTPSGAPVLQCFLEPCRQRRWPNADLDFSAIIKGSLCFSFFFSYPIMMFPVTSILEKKMAISAGSVLAMFLR